MKQISYHEHAISEIMRLHDEIGGFFRMTFDNAIRIGELLSGIKADLPHGEWSKWVKEALPFSDRLARDYIRFYNRRDELKTARVASLTEARRLLKSATVCWSDLDPEEFVSRVRDGSIFDVQLRSWDDLHRMFDLFLGMGAAEMELNISIERLQAWSRIFTVLGQTAGEIMFMLESRIGQLIEEAESTPPEMPPPKVGGVNVGTIVPGEDIKPGELE